tara:strand:+ start:27 stop:368 length:342 start_codon:yes stop_codon:yes gene_type:complete
MELKVSGKITNVLPPQSGKTNSGTQWTKMTFVVDNGEQYNNIFAFEIWKDEKVQQFNQYNNVGDSVVVSFNVDCSEYNGKYYTNLKAWKIQSLNDVGVNEPTHVGAEEEDTPF